MERRDGPDVDPGGEYITADPAFATIKSLLRSGERILDIGCGFGNVGGFLAGSGAVVDGIEPDSVRATAAATRLNQVFETPMDEAADLASAYDTAMLIDVVEHFTMPVAGLTHAASFVRPGGRILLFLPNSAHWSFRLKILRGDWSYSDWGLFDRTHVRFFDLRSAEAMITAAGLRERRRWSTTPATGLASRLGIRLRPSLFALHFLFELEKA